MESGKTIRLLILFWSSLIPLAAKAQIPQPLDAPKPLSAEEASRTFALPEGYRLELVASEPLIREPSGVAFDERGRMFVCELHGYNLEGQYDIEELNRTGELDREVRRIQANPRAKEAADAETYSTIKLLRDRDGDGRIDEAVVWADRLPPCLGLCATRDGLIAACQTQILFLADRDGDDRAEVREVWFEGFEKGPLERTINYPQWGPDNWIYFGCGTGGGTIHGKYLTDPVDLPRTDFRIKPDGSAIEPVVGRTGTVGFTFTEAGDRLVISTNTPGIFVAPLPWNALARNPNYSPGRLEENASSDQRVYPTSQPHPWRTHRAEDPGFSKYYTDRYGIAESAPNGYFTSACSPLVYQDTALPGLLGQILACEPAQNLVHRALVTREGSRLRLGRPASEETSEFLTSTDPWFHPISLAHAPDGSIIVTDFYREIIEDYSAIPRYLQQQYGLMAGHEHGRLWRLTHESIPKDPWVGEAVDMSELTTEQLVEELASPRWWRRQTARRMLIESSAQHAALLPTSLTKWLTQSADTATIFSVLQTLEGLGSISTAPIEFALNHSEPAVRRLGLQLAERELSNSVKLAETIHGFVDDPAALVRLQVAITLGEMPPEQAEKSIRSLAQLARVYGDEPWMIDAILSSVGDRPTEFLSELVRLPDELGLGELLLKPLCLTIGNRRKNDELSEVVIRIAQLDQPRFQVLALRGLRSAFHLPFAAELTEAARAEIKKLAWSADAEVGREVAELIQVLQVESPEERAASLLKAARALDDIQLPIEERLAAVVQLSQATDDGIAVALVASIPTATPQVQEAILQGVFAHQSRLSVLLDAIADGHVVPSMLSAVQRAALLDSSDAEIRDRAVQLLNQPANMDSQLFGRYMAALRGPRDGARGQVIFKEHCGKCHQAHGVGQAVGPDLSAEFQRAEETIIRDVLAPNDSISAGYATYLIETDAGQVLTGVMVAESPTSVTLKQSDAVERVILRAEIERLRTMPTSIMPEDLYKSVSPQDLADAIHWLRTPASADRSP